MKMTVTGVTVSLYLAMYSSLADARLTRLFASIVTSSIDLGSGIVLPWTGLQCTALQLQDNLMPLQGEMTVTVHLENLHIALVVLPDLLGLHLLSSHLLHHKVPKTRSVIAFRQVQ